MEAVAKRVIRDALAASIVAVIVAIVMLISAKTDVDPLCDPPTPCPRIIGLRDARRAIRNAVLVPIAAFHARGGDVHPLLRPCNGVILTGPPGTGKTLLARWTATQVGSFYSVSAGSVQSKWYGETPKLIKRLFDAARASAPSVIFIDELDGLLSSRTSMDLGAEKELKTTMLIEMSRLEHELSPVIVMAATNRINDIDPAILRRIRVRIHVPLPDACARLAALRSMIPEIKSTFTRAIELTDGMSCSDIREIAKSAVSRAHIRGGDGGFGVTEADVVFAALALCPPSTIA